MVPTDCIVALPVDETPEGYSSLPLPEEHTMISSAPVQVAVDIGSRIHYVAIGHSEGQIVDEFTIPHTQEGFNLFSQRLEQQQRVYALPVRVAMEGYNGWARPLDTEVLRLATWPACLNHVLTTIKSAPKARAIIRSFVR
jgi:hypothetical protein